MTLQKSLLLACLAAASLGSSARAVVVFSDDFSEPTGTAILGKSPDVGTAYSGSTGGLGVSDHGSLSTVGAGRAIFGGFTTPLGAGQMLTLTFDSLNLPNLFTSGYSGVSLYAGGNERIFLGDAGGNANNLTWAVDGGAVGLHLSSDATSATSAVFTYVYDTGAWTFTTTSGVNLSGTGATGEAYNEIRVANGNGGDIDVDNVVASITPVPEPSAALLLGLCGLGAGLRRKRTV